MRNWGLFAISEGLIATLIISAALIRPTSAPNIHWLIAGQIYQATSLIIIPAILMTHFGMRIIYQYGDLSSPNIPFNTQLKMLVASAFIFILIFRLVINPIRKYLRSYYSNLGSTSITFMALGFSFWVSSLASSWASHIEIFKTY